MPARIPDPLIAFYVVLENERCPDCAGYTVHAVRLGAEGRFCDCPYDSRHD